MIWKHAINNPPECHCKCEVLLPREDGDIDQYEADYDSILKVFLIPTLSEDKFGQHTHVSHWRAL